MTPASPATHPDININAGTGRLAVVQGLGLFGGGSAAARHLAERGWRVLVTDLRTPAELEKSVAELADLPIEYRLGEHRLADFQSAALVVKNPGVKPGNEYLAAAKHAGAHLTTEVRLFIEACPARIAAVTGSNGKTTTAHMLAAILRRECESRQARAWLGGNVGGSLLPDLPNIAPADWVVLELSSFQLMDLDDAGISPPVAAITNITPNHLDWHRDMAEYVRAKSAIFRHQTRTNTAILNLDDPVTSRLTDACPGRIIRYGMTDHALHLGAEVAWHDEARIARITLQNTDPADLFTAADLQVPGRHNISNALCAAAMSSAANATPAHIRDGIRAFTGVEHRLELAATIRGVRWFNDSIATTPESTVAALRSFTEPVYLLLGGSDKGLSFDNLAQEIAAARNIRVIYLTGPVAPKIGEAIHRAAAARPDPSRYLRVETVAVFDDAVTRAAREAVPGDVFLMSPACASFYEYAPSKKFANFEARGKHFKELVAALRPKPPAKPR